MYYGMAFKAGFLLLLAVAAYTGINAAGRLINRYIDDYIDARETLLLKQVEVAEMKARNDYLKQLADVTDAFQQEKNTLLESAHKSLLDAQEELYRARTGGPWKTCGAARPRTPATPT